jgi:Protein of unknown function (DUF3754)
MTESATFSAPQSAAAGQATRDPHQAEPPPRRDKALPVTRSALLDRLTAPEFWPNGEAAQARRFLCRLDYWRRHGYAARLLDMGESYEPFSPDTDLPHSCAFTPAERAAMQKRLLAQTADLLQQANFTRLEPASVPLVLTKVGGYGLAREVDLDAFEEILIYYRGATTIAERRRDATRAYMRWKEVQIPVFQRICLLFKLKPFDIRVKELMHKRRVRRRQAERLVRRMRGRLSATVAGDCIYIKLFKNMPRSGVEMVFPNAKMRLRRFDKVKFAAAAGVGLLIGVIGVTGKLAAMSNPYVLFGAIGGLGGIALRQAAKLLNLRSRYMDALAHNLYFHAIADNRGVMTLLAERAAEEDVKEEMLLYSVLAKERVNVRELTAVDEAIEQFLEQTFGITVECDVEHALARLKAEGIVAERPDGTLATLPPHEAALRIEELWQGCLDALPAHPVEEGDEVAAIGEGRGAG